MLSNVWNKVRPYLIMVVVIGIVFLLACLFVVGVVSHDNSGYVYSAKDWILVLSCMVSVGVFCIWWDFSKKEDRVDKISVEEREGFEREWRDKVANIKSGDTVKIREDLEQRQRNPSRLPGGYCIYTNDTMLSCKGKEAKVLDKCIDLLVLDIPGINLRENMWHVWQVDKV